VRRPARPASGPSPPPNRRPATDAVHPRTWLRGHNRSVCWNLSSKRHPDQPHALAFQIRLPLRIRVGSTSTPRGLQYGAVPVDARAAAQHRDRSIDHGDPPVTKPGQMLHRLEPPPAHHGGDARLWQIGGRIDQHVRNVSVVEDVLIQRAQ
jgi:hypothetical protein